MKKVLRVIGKIGKGVVKGVIDTALPNVKHSIKMSEPDLPDQKPKFEIDFVRLITAVTVWILLLLVFFGKVKFSDVLDVLLNLLKNV